MTQGEPLPRASSHGASAAASSGRIGVNGPDCQGGGTSSQDGDTLSSSPGGIGAGGPRRSPGLPLPR